eukprot:151003-Rhodomonas_salina.1
MERDALPHLPHCSFRSTDVVDRHSCVDAAPGCREISIHRVLRGRIRSRCSATSTVVRNDSERP